MKRLGHHLTIITSGRGLPVGAYDGWNGKVGQVIRYPEQFTFLEIPVVPQIPLRLLSNSDYDVFHIHGMTPTQTDLALLIARSLDYKVVYTHHFDPQTRGGRLTRVYSLLGRTFAGLADVITASTASYAESSPILSHLLTKVRIIPMGVDPAKFDNIKATIPARGREIFESFDSRVLYVGKLIYYKGLEHLLKAFSLIRIRDSCLIIVGEGREKPNLIRLARQSGISDRVFFLGRQPEWKLPAIYAMSNVVTLPSITRREAFGIVLLEAMASGKPVIASKIPGVSEVVKEGETGCLVPPSDHIALAQALQTLLEDVKTANRMGQAGKILVKNKYSWDRIAQEFLELYAHDVDSCIGFQGTPGCVPSKQ